MLLGLPKILRLLVLLCHMVTLTHCHMAGMSTYCSSSRCWPARSLLNSAAGSPFIQIRPSFAAAVSTPHSLMSHDRLTRVVYP
ncbi:hypothetical protein C8Q80DRAFT_1152935, partial [Daedaleopsis nitida]